MKQRLLIVLFTALVFGAGFGAHVWITGQATVPPPPVAIGSEFAHGPGTPPASTVATNAKPAAPASSSSQPFDRAKLLSEIQRYSSQIKVYQTRLDELDAEFDRAILPLLTETQRDCYTTRQKRLSENRAKGMAAIAAETAPLSDEQIFRLQRVPLMGVLSSVSISMRYDSLNKDVKFDDAQSAKVHELLRVRRDKFLDLVDAMPPPTITLSRLAPHAEKIAADPTRFEPPK